jgi:hypothetical protein
LIFSENSASEPVGVEPLSNRDTAEREALSVNTAPSGLPFFGVKSASGFRTFDFDIRVQHFQLITGSIENMERPVELVKGGNVFFATATKKFYMSKAM